jgi:leader peptidase (prepilin peptidase)/N-methyltransferase
MDLGPCAPKPAMISDELRFLHPRHLNIKDDWPIYGLYMYLLASLLAASLIDIESYSIPPVIFWWAAGVGIVVHAIIDNPQVPGTLTVGPIGACLAVGGGIGLISSALLLYKGLIPLSFAHGQPLLEVDKKKLREQRQEAMRRGGKVLEYEIGEDAPDFTPAQIRGEINKEILFLLPPLVLGLALAMAAQLEPSIKHFWEHAVSADWLSGALGAVLGALVGGFIVWLTRIIGSMIAGREAMGLGDVHLMFGVGAFLGAGGATLAFFIAPFFGLAIAVYRWISGKGRELPYGPFLGLGTAAVMLFYCPMAAYLAPGLQGAAMLIRDVFVRQ